MYEAGPWSGCPVSYPDPNNTIGLLELLRGSKPKLENLPVSVVVYEHLVRAGCMFFGTTTRRTLTRLHRQLHTLVGTLVGLTSAPVGVVSEGMVQDSITDHIDTARGNSSHLNFTCRMAIIFAEIAP